VAPPAHVPPRRLILESGAVIAWSRDDGRARAILTRALELALDVPTAVLAEILGGGPRDAPIHRVRNAVDVVFPADERMARLAGTLLGRTGGSNTVDALVGAEAATVGADVLPGDPDELCALLVGHRSVDSPLSGARAGTGPS
jgi:hypothetical protein